MLVQIPNPIQDGVFGPIISWFKFLMCYYTYELLMMS